MHPMLNTAVKAARRAGAIINRASLELERVQVTRKSGNDFVTEIDRACEKAVIEVLAQAYPDHCFLGEESGYTNAAGEAIDAPTAANTRNLWIIDPLDGTTNFIHGLPIYAVSIALMQDGQITQGVVYDPSRDELFMASKGKGAYVNDRRLRVSKQDRVEESMLGTGFPFRPDDDFELYTAMLKKFTSRMASIRRPGAAAIDLAYVAAGRFDGFFEMGLMPWDAAAGALLVTEAGGYVGNFHGNEDYLFTENIIAASPKVFAQMVSLLSPFVLPPPRKAPGLRPAA